MNEVDAKQLQSAYSAFFEKSEAGQHFMLELARLLKDKHLKAEDDPDHSLAFTQQAKGLREISNHIQIIISDTKKGAIPQ